MDLRTGEPRRFRCSPASLNDALLAFGSFPAALDLGELGHHYGMSAGHLGAEDLLQVRDAFVEAGDEIMDAVLLEMEIRAGRTKRSLPT